MGNCFAASENSVNPVITRPLSPGWSTMKTGSNSNETSELSVISTSTTCPSMDDITRVKEAFPNLRDFTLQELKSATQNFKASNVIGEGGFGRVYKGWVDESNPAKHQLGIVVAVKNWNPESFQGLQEWKVIAMYPSGYKNPIYFV